MVSREILDMGGSRLQTNLKDMLLRDFIQPTTHQERTLPTELFYNEIGAQLWRRISRTDAYYQTEDEMRLLKEHGAEISGHILPESIIVDMGSGDIHKILPLLAHLESLKKKVHYFALDLCKDALQYSLSELPGSYEIVECPGLWGTFEDGLQWLKTVRGPKVILSLGSMLGNDEFNLAVERLCPWEEIMSGQDFMLLGLDGCQDQERLWNCYHDTEGQFEAFIRNGLSYLNLVLRCEWYWHVDWAVSDVTRTNPTRHQFCIVAQKDLQFPELGWGIKTGEKIYFFESWKYGPDVMALQFAGSGMAEVGKWKSPGAPFYEYLLRATRHTV